MRGCFQNRWLAGPVTVLVAVSLLAVGLSGHAQPPGSPSPPRDLPGTVDALASNLTRIAEAETLASARSAHATVEPLAPRVIPYAVDLADRQGALVATLLDELAVQLAAGNLSDARSLAQAATNTLTDDIVPRVDRWETNRTAIAPGPLSRTDAGVRVAIVLVHPPPARIGAVDVTLTTGNATPLEASVATGQGEATVDRVNGTARVASFDAQALANLGTESRERVVLGQAVLDAEGLSPGDRLPLGIHVEALADAEGRSVLALGLSHQALVPASEDDGLLGPRWWALGGLVVGGLIVALWIQRWEL